MRSFVFVFGAMPLLMLSLSMGCLTEGEAAQIESVESALRGGTGFVAPLSGGAEVPPVSTKARGNALFALDSTGSELAYRLIVANIEDVTQAHIHMAPAGENGPVITFLFGFIPEGVTQNGILAEGTITEADLVMGTMADLVAAMRAGNTYVNVHTIANPPGEIRGQIRPTGR